MFLPCPYCVHTAPCDTHGCLCLSVILPDITLIFDNNNINTQAVKNSVVAEIDLGILKCFQKDDGGLWKTISRNVAFSLLESVTPVVPLLS
jgi:hypothetical protein